jgi:hypothetical protein
MWCRIKEINTSYTKFLTQRQLTELGLSPRKAQTQQTDDRKNLHTQNQLNESPSEIYDEDTIILMIPPDGDSQSESPDYYRNPHKLP